MEVGDSAVHELQQNLQVLMAGPIQNDNQLSVEGRVLEQLAEVGAAGGQHQTVGFERLACGGGGMKISHRASQGKLAVE